ncbi:MAG: DUF6174 domain-containing protein [Gemmatimonadaceae bacterium]
MSRLTLTPILSFVAGSALACASPLSPGESRALDEAQARWAARTFQSYSFETRIGCFCPPILNEWSRVEVVNGSVTRVVLLESGTEVSPEERVYFRTVEQVFDDIRAASRHEWVKDVVVRFDPELGYPTLIRLVPEEGILDAGSEQHLRNAAALP